MPESTKQHRDRRRGYRAADRRRRAEQELRLAASLAEYAASRIGNGLAPEDARQEALMAAGELEAVAAAVRRLARLDHAGHIALAALLRGQGLSTRQIALRIGVCERAVRMYLQDHRVHIGYTREAKSTRLSHLPPTPENGV